MAVDRVSRERGGEEVAHLLGPPHDTSQIRAGGKGRLPDGLEVASGGFGLIGGEGKGDIPEFGFDGGESAVGVGKVVEDNGVGGGADVSEVSFDSEVGGGGGWGVDMQWLPGCDDHEWELSCQKIRPVTEGDGDGIGSFLDLFDPCGLKEGDADSFRFGEEKLVEGVA